MALLPNMKILASPKCLQDSAGAQTGQSDVQVSLAPQCPQGTPRTLWEARSKGCWLDAQHSRGVPAAPSDPLWATMGLVWRQGEPGCSLCLQGSCSRYQLKGSDVSTPEQ